MKISSKALLPFACLAASLGFGASRWPALEHSDGAELIGKPAPDLRLEHWLNSPALNTSDLRGHVVLLRWFTDGCPLCAATAPALIKLENEFGNRGFTVIGVFHPKPAGDWNVDRARNAAASLGFAFPVALDGDWSALKRWWPGARDYTSVSFLVDKRGTIRYVHPGGEYHEAETGHALCRRDFKDIEANIRKLLAE